MRVAHLGAQPQRPVRAFELFRGQFDDAGQPGARAPYPAQLFAGPAVDDLVLRGGGPLEGVDETVAEQPVDRHGQLDAFLDALVPGTQHLVVELEGRHVVVGAAGRPGLDGSALHPQEPQLDQEGVAAAWLGEALGAQVRPLAERDGVLRAHQDAELPAQPVLRARGAIGVEDVALEQHRVGGLPRRRETALHRVLDAFAGLGAFGACGLCVSAISAVSAVSALIS